MVVDEVDIARMREQLFFDVETARKSSRFWLLLVLAGVIASAGVVGDSTATVIGAMIVAPLMTPILGIALAAALADRPNLLRCLALLVAGTVAVIAIGWLVGLFTAYPVLAPENSQVAGRVSPRLVDLVAALATGAVGAVALCRSDISDTLPGVAIAISLVPPLTVVGLTLESGSASQAGGALLLFVTNVSAILAMGTVVMALYRVTQHAEPTASRTRSRVTQVVVAMVLLVAVPLAVTSVRVARADDRQSKVRDVAERWAGRAGWEVDDVELGTEVDVDLKVTGSEPAPEVDDLRDDLDEAGMDDVSVEVDLVPSSEERI